MHQSGSGTRERFLDASAQLFRRQGYFGTGLKEIVAAGDAPWGSLYHFFPDGKEELGVETILRAGARYEKLVQIVFERHDDPAAAVHGFYYLSIDALEQSDYADGCPVATVALEVASRSEPLRLACAEVFRRWEALTAEKLIAGGVSPEAAPDLASAVLSLFEGAVLLSRSSRDTGALRSAADQAARLVAAAAA